MARVELIVKKLSNCVELWGHQNSTHPFDSGNFIALSTTATVERVEMFDYQSRVIITICLIPAYAYLYEGVPIIF